MKDPIATEMAGAVLQAMIDAYDDPSWGAMPPCTAGLVSGGTLIADHCCDQDPTGELTGTGVPCEGQLTVRVVDSFPTREFPSPHTGTVTGCESWAVVLEIGVLRCALGMDTSTNPPTPPSMEEELVVAERALGDAGLLRHTLVTFAREHGSTALALGSYQPMGPDGGCVGGAVTATLLVE